MHCHQTRISEHENKKVIVFDISRVKSEGQSVAKHAKDFLTEQFPGIKFSLYFGDTRFWISTSPYSEDFIRNVADMLNGEFSDRVEIPIGVGSWNV